MVRRTKTEEDDRSPLIIDIVSVEPPEEVAMPPPSIPHPVFYDMQNEERYVTQEDVDNMQRIVSAFGELIKMIKVQSGVILNGGNLPMAITAIVEQARASEAMVKNPLVAK